MGNVEAKIEKAVEEFNTKDRTKAANDLLTLCQQQNHYISFLHLRELGFPQISRDKVADTVYTALIRSRDTFARTALELLPPPAPPPGSDKKLQEQYQKQLNNFAQRAKSGLTADSAAIALKPLSEAADLHNGGADTVVTAILNKFVEYCKGDKTYARRCSECNGGSQLSCFLVGLVESTQLVEASTIVLHPALVEHRVLPMAAVGQMFFLCKANASSRLNWLKPFGDDPKLNTLEKHRPVVEQMMAAIDEAFVQFVANKIAVHPLLSTPAGALEAELTIVNKWGQVGLKPSAKVQDSGAAPLVDRVIQYMQLSSPTTAPRSSIHRIMSDDDPTSRSSVLRHNPLTTAVYLYCTDFGDHFAKQMKAAQRIRALLLAGEAGDNDTDVAGAGSTSSGTGTNVKEELQQLTEMQSWLALPATAVSLAAIHIRGCAAVADAFIFSALPHVPDAEAHVIPILKHYKKQAETAWSGGGNPLMLQVRLDQRVRRWKTSGPTFSQQQHHQQQVHNNATAPNNTSEQQSTTPTAGQDDDDDDDDVIALIDEDPVRDLLAGLVSPRTDVMQTIWKDFAPIVDVSRLTQLLRQCFAEVVVGCSASTATSTSMTLSERLGPQWTTTLFRRPRLRAWPNTMDTTWTFTSLHADMVRAIADALTTPDLRLEFVRMLAKELPHAAREEETRVTDCLISTGRRIAEQNLNAPRKEKEEESYFSATILPLFVRELYEDKEIKRKRNVVDYFKLLIESEVVSVNELRDACVSIEPTDTAKEHSRALFDDLMHICKGLDENTPDSGREAALRHAFTLNNPERVEKCLPFLPESASSSIQSAVRHWFAPALSKGQFHAFVALGNHFPQQIQDCLADAGLCYRGRQKITKELFEQTHEIGFIHFGTNYKIDLASFGLDKIKKENSNSDNNSNNNSGQDNHEKRYRGVPAMIDRCSAFCSETRRDVYSDGSVTEAAPKYPRLGDAFLQSLDTCLVKAMLDALEPASRPTSFSDGSTLFTFRYQGWPSSFFATWRTHRKQMMLNAKSDHDVMVFRDPFAPKARDLAYEKYLEDCRSSAEASASFAKNMDKLRDFNTRIGRTEWVSGRGYVEWR